MQTKKEVLSTLDAMWDGTDDPLRQDAISCAITAVGTMSEEAVGKATARDDDPEGLEPFDVVCKFCKDLVPAKTAHLHQNEYVGDDCCWDERLRVTE